MKILIESRMNRAARRVEEALQVKALQKSAIAPNLRERWAEDYHQPERYNPLLKEIRTIRNLKGETNMHLPDKKDKKKKKAAVVEKERPDVEEQEEGDRPSLKSLKAMSNAAMRKLCEKNSIPCPKSTGNESVEHMFLLGALKKHFGYGKNKEEKTGRVGKNEAVRRIYETTQNLEKQQSRIISLLEKLLEG